MTHEAPSVEALALGLLRAAATGFDPGDTVAMLVAAVIRTSPAGSPPWCEALAVLEAGAFRVRAAVDLAAHVLDGAVQSAKGRVGT